MFQDNDSDDGPEFFEGGTEEFKAFMENRLKQMRKEQECLEEVRKATNAKSEIAERQILMKLWGDLGNSHHSYFLALKAAHQFIHGLNGMRDIDGLPDDLRLLIAKALADCAMIDVEAIQATIEAKAKHQIE